MAQRVAFISGITGQDGSILANQLLGKGYKVYGMMRRSSSNSLGCSTHLQDIPGFEVVEGDLLDLTSLLSLVKKTRPDYFYNMGAMSHVGTSFDQPILTAQVTGIGVLNCLEAIRQSGIFTRFLTASTSEMYGGISSEPANELTPFHPRSPYGCAKLFGYWITVNYRESYKMFACNTICFNHEEPGKRGPNFVTRKISLGVAAIKNGDQDKLFLGNLKAKRDWGTARDFCFPKGTKVLVKNPENSYHQIGSRSIEDIKIGDEVLSFDTKRSVKVFDKVIDNQSRYSDNLYKISFSNKNEIITTFDHPIAVTKQGEIVWTKASELQKGDKVLQYNHFSTNAKIENFTFNPNTEIIQVVSVEKQSVGQDVFNLTTEKYHNYFAYGILVHNCKGMSLVIESAYPDDYVLATGETHTVEEFCKLAFEHAGLGDYKQYVETDPRFYRPAEVDVLIGDYSKINKALGWRPETKFEDLVKCMVDWDLQHYQKKG